jgi:hypothetical protein
MNGERGAAPRRRSINKKIVGLAAALVLALIVVGGIVWTTRCPCGAFPGLVLLGDVQDQPVTDWSFANDISLCQIQITTTRGPHAVNLNCMATPDGQLYLSCSVGARKFWCLQVKANSPGRLRLNGVVYPVLLNRVTDEATLDAAWAARIRKLQKPEVRVLQPGGDTGAPPVDTPRPDSWWTFNVRSRTG